MIGDFDLPLSTSPMEARSAERLPGPEELWYYEPKWDGFRCLAFKAQDHVELRAKSGKPLGRYFPEVLAFLRALPVRRFVLDGELVIEIKGHLAFDSLQMRLHPAESRICKLSNETPARLVVFDILAEPDGSVVMEQPLERRRELLERLTPDLLAPKQLVLSPITGTLSRAETWLRQSGHDATDSVVAKERVGIYQPGKRAMIKVKRLRTADCVVGGFRYESGSAEVGSLLLGLYNSQGMLDHVGFTATITDRERPALTKRLEALREPPGFTGKSPGRPSRWSTERTGEWNPVRRSWSSKCASTMSPAIASATGQSYCGGVRTRRRTNAHLTRSDHRLPTSHRDAVPLQEFSHCLKSPDRRPTKPRPPISVARCALRVAFNR